MIRIKLNYRYGLFEERYKKRYRVSAILVANSLASFECDNYPLIDNVLNQPYLRQWVEKWKTYAQQLCLPFEIDPLTQPVIDSDYPLETLT